MAAQNTYQLKPVTLSTRPGQDIVYITAIHSIISFDANSHSVSIIKTVTLQSHHIQSPELNCVTANVFWLSPIQDINCAYIGDVKKII